MKIWIITNLYAPDVHGGATLYTDMAQFYNKQGHDVRVTTTFPYYPAWELRPEDRGIKLRIDDTFGIPTRRVSIYMPSKLSGAKRSLSDLSFLWSILRRGKFPKWVPDQIITAEPMLSQVLALRLVYPFKHRIRKTVIVQDFAADAAIELGLIKNPIFCIIARKIERYALKGGDLVTTISPGMLEKLHDVLGIPHNPDGVTLGHLKTKYIPNWIHSQIADGAAIKLKNPPLRDKRTLVYAGNVGQKQGLPEFVKTFTSIPHNWNLKIYGSGAAAIELKKLLDELNDPRVELFGILDEDAYLERLLTATACLITQRVDTGANFLPSKVLPCIAANTAILAVTPRNTPLAKEILEAQNGTQCDPNSKEALAQALTQLSLIDYITIRLNSEKRAAIYAPKKSLDQLLRE